jgi:predicted ATPase/DNA-binding CsgD family transcriptional regulator
MPALPTGTITFLFTDIEGSTHLLRELRTEYATVLADYRRLLASAVQARGGLEVDAPGDAVFFAIPRATDAVAAAIAAQRAIHAHAWPGGAAIRVRIGLHTGEPLAAETGYVGMDVHRAARICSAAHGGQILLSQATWALVADDLPDGVTLLDLGEWRLKDLPHLERLYQAVVPDLPAKFPPLRTLDSFPNNLPRELTSFVGRQCEMAEIKALLESALLLTLTGAGGSGKTRLALHVAADVVDQYPDGVWWVELASLSEPAFVPQAVATALGIREHRGRSVTDVLCEHIGQRTLLLVLDNAEHLLLACATLVDSLLRHCGGLRVLATSREALGVEGEQSYPVPPLAVPAPGMLLAVGTLAQSEAVCLFVDRATAARPGFALNEQNAAAVLEICRRVEGIPLAIELAAARIKALSVPQIAQRLGDQFSLLTGGVRTGLPRHQTLRAAMDWSYDLLTDRERDLFRRLAVFTGGFGLEAAEAICAGTGLEPPAILDLLTRLVEKSLVFVETRDAEHRYRLLEPVHQYALTRSQQNDEASAIAIRHRDFYLALAEQGHCGLASVDRAAWRARIELDHENIRAALRRSIDTGDPEQAARLGAAMARFWVSRGFLHEGRTRLGELRRHEAQMSAGTRARLLTGVGLLAFEIGDHEQAEVARQALAIFRALRDREELEVCARLLGMVEVERGNYGPAAALLEEAGSLARERGDVEAEGEALRQRGYLAAKQGDYSRAAQDLERSLAVARRSGRRRSIGLALGHLAQTYHYRGASDQAIVMLREALAHLEAVEHGTGIAYFLNVLGLALREQGDQRGAAEAYRRDLAFSRETGYKWGIAHSLIGCAALAAAGGGAPSAIGLLGAADRLVREIDYTLPSAEQTRLHRLTDDLRRTVDSDAFAVGWRSGQAMPVDEAVEWALRALEEARGVQSGSGMTQTAQRPQVSQSLPRAPLPRKPASPLSQRERQVAALVVRGLTNREIAETLGIAEKTANVHIQHILNKLGFNSRAQIAAWAVTQDLSDRGP